MLDYLNQLLTKISLTHLNALLLLAIALFGGTIGGRLFQKLKIPQVVGYIVIGIAIGQTGLNLINQELIKNLQPLSYFALGLIGFMIGGELKKEVLRKYGKQFITILLFEGMVTFFLVFICIGFFGSLFFGGMYNFWVLGLLLGAIASATAPAATTDVLWENRTRGPLTTTILGIVAMDDGLALILFAIVSAISTKILGTTGHSFVYTITHPIYEIGGGILVGIIFGLILSKALKKYTQNDKILVFSLGSVLFVLGISLAIKVDMLLAAMTLGVVIVNRTPLISKKVFSLMEGISSPIYILFFVLVGAKLNLRHISILLAAISLIYLLSRTLGKMIGANIGAKVAKAPITVQKYLPFCLFSQAGVAIGLSIVAYHAFPGDIGNFIVIIIMFSTFIVQLLGPPSVKYAVTQAGEINLNISEKELLEKTRIKDMVQNVEHLISASTPLDEILNIFSKGDHYSYPVVNKDNKLIGIITVESIRRTFTSMELSKLLVAVDIMTPVVVTASLEDSLSKAREALDRYTLNYMLVVTKEKKVVGCIYRTMFNKFIASKMIEFEQKQITLAK